MNLFRNLLAAQSRLGDHPGSAGEKRQRPGDRKSRW
jgi:hypothetical protein